MRVDRLQHQNKLTNFHQIKVYVSRISYYLAWTAQPYWTLMVVEHQSQFTTASAAAGKKVEGAVRGGNQGSDWSREGAF